MRIACSFFTCCIIVYTIQYKLYYVNYITWHYIILHYYTFYYIALYALVSSSTVACYAARPEWHGDEEAPVAPEETQVAVRAMGTEGEQEARALEVELARERPGVRGR